MSLKDLLSNVANGDYDGERIDNEESGVSWGFYTDRGTPVQYREDKSSKFFNGKENERIPGTRTEERFDRKIFLAGGPQFFSHRRDRLVISRDRAGRGSHHLLL